MNTHQNQCVALVLDTKPDCEFHWNVPAACVLLTGLHPLTHPAQQSDHSCILASKNVQIMTFTAGIPA